MLNGNRKIVRLCLLCLCSLAPAWAQDQSGGPCSDAKSHQFDFWIGEWEVTANGKLAGTNRIEPILGGCVLQENWTGAGASGTSGTSLNYYNPTTGKWHQFWVWQSGVPLPMLSGEYEDGKMVLEGKGPNSKGEMLHHRISWRNNEDGSVRQHWEISKDDGKTWQTSFDGLYRKKSK